MATVAGQGDTVYIGAGTYDDSGYFNAARKSSSGILSIVGDTQGTFTGDRGDVVIRSPSNRWGIRVERARGVRFQGLRFEAYPGRTSYGIGISSSIGVVSIDDCEFAEVRYSIRDYGGNQLEVTNSVFSGQGYGVYATDCTSLSVNQCRFDGLLFGCLPIDVPVAKIGNSVFRGPSVRSRSDYYDRGIYGRRTALQVQNCQFEGCYEAVRGDDVAGAQIADCRFVDTVWYACECDGSNLSLTDSIFDGGYVGVALAHQDGSAAQLRNVDVRNVRFGVVAFEGDYDFNDVAVENCLVGLYQASSNPRLSLTQADTLEFDSNEYAIYSTRPSAQIQEVSNGSGDEESSRDERADDESDHDGANGEDGSQGSSTGNDDSDRDDDGGQDTGGSGTRLGGNGLFVRGQDLSGNRRAIRAFGRQVEVLECELENSLYGIALTDCADSDVIRCEFEGNASSPEACYFAVYADNTGLQFSECKTRNSLYGLYLFNLGQSAPILRDNVIEKHTYAGVRVQGGQWSYRGDDNNLIRESRYGVIANSMNWSIQDVTTDATCEIPILEFYGDCTANGLRIPGGQRGFYAYGSRSLRLANFAVENCTGTGIDIRDCDGIVLEQGVSSSNQNGVHINDPDGEIPAIRDCEFSGNTWYGLVLVGTTLSPTTPANLRFTNNRYGLAVRDQPLTITPELGLTITGNVYGIVCFRNELSMSEIELTGNGIGAYLYSGGLVIDSSKIQASEYGVIAFLSTQGAITDSRFEGGKNGIYARALVELPEAIRLSSVQVHNTSGYAFGLVGTTTDTVPASISDCSVNNAGRGLLTLRVDSTVQNTHFKDLQTYGHYQYSGGTELVGCSFTDIPNGWAVYAKGDRCNVSRSRIARCKYGIGVLAESGRVTNTTIHRTTAGIYLNRDGSRLNVFHATVAGGTDYGVIRNRGDLLLRNSIVQSNRYALYNADSSGDFEHSHNVVHGQTTPYRNTAPGIDELSKDPGFVDVAQGDLRLASGSPAINAGLDLSQWIANDIEGHARPSFKGFEMGAYEYLKPDGSIRVIKWDEVAR
ncbi:MAG: right-handed parallel beta-helix repeat-containing protein [Planctomycetota bacterium]